MWSHINKRLCVDSLIVVCVHVKGSNGFDGEKGEKGVKVGVCITMLALMSLNNSLVLRNDVTFWLIV